MRSTVALLITSLLAVACQSSGSSGASRGPREPAAWKTLFDGKTTAGWVAWGGRYDGNARWTIEDGALTGRQNLKQEGGLIYTEGFYSNFEFEVDVKCDYPFDSGIFLRMVPDEKGAQVTIDYRPNGEIGAIYSDGFLQHNLDGGQLFKKDEWNHFKVVCTGRDLAIDTWLNGSLLCSYRMEPGSVGYAPTGRIGLQVHGGENVPLETKVQFKNMRVKELPVAEEPVTVDAPGGAKMLSHRALLDGWRPLFDGKTLEGWDVRGPAEGVEVKGGALMITSGDGELRSKGDYQDFELYADFQLSKLCNSGVFLRAERSDANPAFSGCEVQVLDDYNWEAAAGYQLHDYQFTGGLYGSVAPGVKGVLKLAPEWNTYHLTFQGSRLRTELNGQVLYDVDTTAVPVQPDTKPFAERAKTGFIGLQRHGAAKEGEQTFVAYKNLFVKKL
ncbi:MAG: DUF1080 domain-containing protein [Planctomycetes bacterium]|nr:DUF1080 domain-containing protein [Planctomycetota bacterium]